MRVLLRDMTEGDIKDYVRWWTRELRWAETDAPWESDDLPVPEENARRSWTAFWEEIRNLPPDAFRQKFEIEADGRHVGWVCSYLDLGYLDNPENIRAVGIDIPDVSVWGRGVGTEALRLYLDYLRARGHTAAYTQTWSGNTAMLRVADKLGFSPFFRLPGFRCVGGKRYDAITLKTEL